MRSLFDKEQNPKDIFGKEENEMKANYGDNYKPKMTREDELKLHRIIQEYVATKIEQLAGKHDDTLHKQFDFQRDDEKENDE